MNLLVEELSESQLLARIFPRLTSPSEAIIGPGDDAAVISAPDGRTVISIDTAVQDKDFRLLWPNGYSSSGFDVGWKCAAQNLSDINAMGAVATSLVVSLTLPGTTPIAWIEDLADGITAAIEQLGATGCSVVGGDLSSGDQLVISIAVTGDLQQRAPVLRSGAHTGDQLTVCGNMGVSAAGWAVQENADAGIALMELAEEATALFNRPWPPLEAGRAAAIAGATAMMDISDGLLRDARRLAQASNVMIDIDSAALRARADSLSPLAQALGVDPLHWVLSGGEDYGLLVTFDARAELPPGFTRIGSVLATSGTNSASQELVTVDGNNYQSAKHGALGWDHFAV